MHITESERSLLRGKGLEIGASPIAPEPQLKGRLAVHSALRGKGLEIGHNRPDFEDVEETPRRFMSVKNGMIYSLIETRERPGRSPVVRLKCESDGSTVTLAPEVLDDSDRFTTVD